MLKSFNKGLNMSVDASFWGAKNIFFIFLNIFLMKIMVNACFSLIFVRYHRV